MFQKNIAAIVTTYFAQSHTDLVLSNFFKGFVINNNYESSKVRISSIYIDQIHWSDIGINTAKKYNIKIKLSVSMCCSYSRKSAYNN